jgi:hypothetical protein
MPMIALANLLFHSVWLLLVINKQLFLSAATN